MRGRFGLLMLSMRISPQMLGLMREHGLLSSMTASTLTKRSIYLASTDAERILAVIPRAGRTGIALRRRAKALLRRWGQAAGREAA